jgi:hypothetical protein
VYVDGTEFMGDPSTIVFRDLQQIALVIGTPPQVIPRNYTGF